MSSPAQPRALVIGSSSDRASSAAGARPLTYAPGARRVAKRSHDHGQFSDPELVVALAPASAVVKLEHAVVLGL